MYTECHRNCQYAEIIRIRFCKGVSSYYCQTFICKHTVGRKLVKSNKTFNFFLSVGSLHASIYFKGMKVKRARLTIYINQAERIREVIDK